MRFTFATIEGGRKMAQTDLDLAHAHDARQEAMRTLGEMVRDQAGKEPYRDIAIDVTDAEGQHVFRLSMMVG